MNKKDKIILIIIAVIIIAVVSFILINKHRIKKNECIKECIYYSEERGTGLFREHKGWNFEGRVFETREQCLNYCLIK